VPNPANPQSLNRYSYCLNNPLRYTDPSGHDGIDWDYIAAQIETYNNAIYLGATEDEALAIVWYFEMRDAPTPVPTPAPAAVTPVVPVINVPVVESTPVPQEPAPAKPLVSLGSIAVAATVGVCSWAAMQATTGMSSAMSSLGIGGSGGIPGSFTENVVNPIAKPVAELSGSLVVGMGNFASEAWGFVNSDQFIGGLQMVAGSAMILYCLTNPVTLPMAYTGITSGVLCFRNGISNYKGEGPVVPQLWPPGVPLPIYK
jgi:hypothetical protein